MFAAPISDQRFSVDCCSSCFVVGELDVCFLILQVDKSIVHVLFVQDSTWAQSFVSIDNDNIIIPPNLTEYFALEWQ
jgi:hypothetical protein